MNQHHFTRQTEDNLVVVPCQVDDDPLALALDTGASHTTIDLTPLLMAGYELKDNIGTTRMETANGEIDTYIFVLREFSSMGLTRKDMKVASYDFFVRGLFAEFDGVLGLDFFEGHKVCLDLAENVITLHTGNKQ